MIEKMVRRASKGIIEAIAKIFVLFGVSPNTMTVISFLVGMIGAYLIVLRELTLAVFLILLSGLLDGVDGTIARLTGKASKFGAFLDSMLDKILEIAIFVAMFFYDQTLALPVILAISSMMLSSYTNKHIAAFNIGKTDHRPFFYVYSIADRFQRMVIVAAALLLPVFLREILYFYVIVLAVSFFQRMLQSYNILK